MGHLDELPPFAVQPLALEQLDDADDAVQRRSDLVAHAGQELALGAARDLGGAGGLLQIPDPFQDLSVEIPDQLAQARSPLTPGTSSW